MTPQAARLLKPVIHFVHANEEIKEEEQDEIDPEYEVDSEASQETWN